MLQQLIYTEWRKSQFTDNILNMLTCTNVVHANSLRGANLSAELSAGGLDIQL
jgi:hypothetical protein